MNQAPDWVTYVSSGAFFIILFSMMMKFIVTGFKDKLTSLEGKIDSMADGLNNIKVEAARSSHLPEQVERLSMRVSDLERSKMWKLAEGKV